MGAYRKNIQKKKYRPQGIKMDDKIRALEEKERKLLKGTKSLLKEDIKHDRLIKKAKKVLKKK